MGALDRRSFGVRLPKDIEEGPASGGHRRDVEVEQLDHVGGGPPEVQPYLEPFLRLAGRERLGTWRAVGLDANVAAEHYVRGARDDLWGNGRRPDTLCGLCYLDVQTVGAVTAYRWEVDLAEQGVECNGVRAAAGAGYTDVVAQGGQRAQRRLHLRRCGVPCQSGGRLAVEHQHEGAGGGTTRQGDRLNFGGTTGPAA